MLNTTRKFVERFKEEHPEIRGRVLDVGSLDVNGNIKDLFADPWEYVGTDMREGSNVDIIVNGHDLVKKFGKNSFDVVVCFDMLEHDDKPWVTVKNMRTVLKRGGWLLLGGPSLNHPRHNHPQDYWRFFREAFVSFLKGFKHVVAEEEIYGGGDEGRPDQVFGWGQKP